MRVPRDRLDFGTVLAHATAAAQLTIDGGEDPWTVQAVEWHGGAASASPPQFAVDADPPVGRRTLRIRFVAPVVAGPQDFALRVTTTNPDVPQFVLNGRVTVVGGLSVVPPRVLLGRCVGGEQGCAVPVLISGAGHLSWKGAEPASAADLIRVEIQEGLPGHWRVTVRYSGARGPSGRQALAVVLACSAAGSEEVRIPVDMVID
jgi:hypothetical protein